MKKDLIKICRNARKASNRIISNKLKNKVLLKFAELIYRNKKKILLNNKKDISKARKIALKDNFFLLSI